MKIVGEKKISVVYISVSLIVILVSFLINDESNVRLVKKLSESIFWLTVPVFITSIITLFLNENVFNVWRRFTNYFLVVAVVIVLITPTSTHGLDFFPIIKETVTIALASIYSIISLIIILYKSLKK